MRENVWVEINPETHLPIRILTSQKKVSQLLYFNLMDRSLAVKLIRRQLWERSKGFCERCSITITEGTSHMHERQHRGRGGEISVENSMLICAACHEFAPHSEHSDRQPKFTRRRRYV